MRPAQSVKLYVISRRHIGLYTSSRAEAHSTATLSERNGAASAWLPPASCWVGKFDRVSEEGMQRRMLADPVWRPSRSGATSRQVTLPTQCQISAAAEHIAQLRMLGCFRATHRMRSPSRSGAASSTASPFQQHATGVGSPAATRAAPATQPCAAMRKPPLCWQPHVGTMCWLMMRTDCEAKVWLWCLVHWSRTVSPEKP
jgi:hypothetical protein